MKNDHFHTNSELIKRYTDQPARLPRSIRNRIEAHWGNRPVLLYAIADLDDNMNLTSNWVALGEHHMAVTSAMDSVPPFVIDIELSAIRTIREVPGLSCTSLSLLGADDTPPLLVLRYTHRQRRAMESIIYMIERYVEGNRIDESRNADDVYAHAVTDAIKQAQSSVAANKLAVVWRLLSYLKPYRKQLIWGLTGAVILTAMNLLPAYLTGYLIDEVIRPFQSGSLVYSKARDLSIHILVILGLAYGIRSIAMHLRLKNMAVLGERVAGDLRFEVFEHLQTLSLSFFSKRQTGNLISRVSSDSDRLWDFIAFGLVEFSLSIVMLLGLGSMLLTLDRRLGLIMTLPIPVFIWSFVVHGNTMQRLFIRALRQWSNITAVLSDNIPGMHVVKAFNQEGREKERFDRQNDLWVSQCNDIHDVWTRFWPFLVLGIHAMTVTVWMFALSRIFGGENDLTIGTFVTFLLYMSMYLQPIETIGMISRLLNRATSSAHRIFEVMDTKPDITDIQKPVALTPIEGHITFEDVSFAYDGMRYVLKNVSFDVKPGEMIGIVGPSGSGKTTLIHLISRFYDVSDGRILIDGVDIRRLDTGRFRHQVGMVLQEPFLFCGTILDNIRYGLPGATMSQVIAASKTADVHDFICKLPHGYDTVIGERGQTLSGGERQRVSIARAVLCNPRILILDEATSSVDTETERKIQDALNALIQGRTVFAIAHRLSTLRRADRLFVIENGKMVEEGTHSELLKNPYGVYTKLQRMQQELHEM